MKRSNGTVIIAFLLISFLSKEAMVTSYSSPVSLEEVIQDSSLIIVAERVPVSASIPQASSGTVFRVKKVLLRGKADLSTNSLVKVEDANEDLWNQIGQLREQNWQNRNVKGYVEVPVPFPIIPTYHSSLSEDEYPKTQTLILFLKKSSARDTWPFTAQNSYETVAMEHKILKLIRPQ